MAPDAIARLGARLDDGSTIVSATNGKTTTAGMIAAALRAAGREPVHNRAGSNMTWGVATALLEQRGDEGLFEVDEAWLPHVAEALDPRLIVLGNLFRDQLDRYGELERLADDWAEVVAVTRERQLALRAQRRRPAGRRPRARPRAATARPASRYFGIEDPRQALPELQHAHDAKHCRRCGAPYATSAPSSATSATTRARTAAPTGPTPTSRRPRSSWTGCAGSRVSVRDPGRRARRCSSPSPASTTSTTRSPRSPRRCDSASPLGQDAARAWSGCRRSFGRVETIEVGERPVSILLIKNPAGANEVLRTLRLEAGADGRRLDLWIALNDRIADGRDVSWVWDADFELLAEPVRRVVCAGTRAPRWRCGSSTRAGRRERDRGRSRDRAPRSTRAVAAARRPPVRASHLHRAARAAQAARRPRPGRVLGMSDEGDGATSSARSAR